MESKRNLTEKCIELFNIGKKSSQIAQETGLSIASVYYRLSRQGDIPDHLMVRHTCDQASCVNPDHLFLGTHQDNMDDKVRRNRQAKGRKCIPKRNL